MKRNNRKGIGEVGRQAANQPAKTISIIAATMASASHQNSADGQDGVSSLGGGVSRHRLKRRDNDNKTSISAAGGHQPLPGAGESGGHRKRR